MSIYLGNLQLATGGGATGTGLPVNSYDSFLVDSTGNPVGYNTATGLYTHPNGDYWMETGNTISDSGGNYPDAVITAASNYNTAEGTTGNYTNAQSNTLDGIQGICQTSTYWYVHGPGGYSQSQNLTRIQKSNFAKTQFGYRLDRANDKIGFDVNEAETLTATVGEDNSTSASEIYIRDFTNYTGSNPGTLLYTVNRTLSYNVPGVIFGEGTTVWVMVQGSSTMTQYDYVSNTLLQTLNAGQSPGTYGYGWSYIGGQYSYLSNAGGIWKVDMVNGGSTLFATFTAEPSLANREPITPDLNNFTNALQIQSTPASTSPTWKIYTKAGPFVGDSTARTDSDSSQPLFLKLK